jgi:hypothetical protein
MKQQARKSWRMIGLSLLLPVAVPAWAHHSFVGYDRTTSVKAEHATLKEFIWGAPHAAAVFVYTDAGGKESEIHLTTASPPSFVRQGFQVADFKVGDTMDVTWFPAKSGRIGGMLATLTLADGRTFKDTELFPAGADNAKQAGAEVP